VLSTYLGLPETGWPRAYAEQVESELRWAMQRLIHDAAFAAATSLMDDLRPLFRDDEVRDGWEIMFETIKAAIEAAFIARYREHERLCKN
jgi:hypothetical protein